MKLCWCFRRVAVEFAVVCTLCGGLLQTGPDHAQQFHDRNPTVEVVVQSTSSATVVRPAYRPFELDSS